MWPQFNQNDTENVARSTAPMLEANFIQQQERDCIFFVRVCEGFLSQQGRRHHYSVNIHYIQSLASFCKINRKLFAERQNAQWPGYLHQDKMKSNGLHDSGLTRWRALAEGDSLLLGSTPPASTPTVLCFPPHSTYPNCPPPPLLLPPFRLLYLWLCPLMWKKLSSGPVDLEIEYSLRSARDGPCSLRDLTQPRV